MESDKEPEKLSDIFTEEVILHLRNNKHEITTELLEQLRSQGNEGKHIALEILDLEKDNEQYYIDAYGNRISFLGNRRLKKAFTKLPLSEIHKEEIKRCSEDIHYFKDNYVKIKTKSGIDFPDLREYQDSMLNTIIEDENESILGLLPRQCCSTDTTIKITHSGKEYTTTFEDMFAECRDESKKGKE